MPSQYEAGEHTEWVVTGDAGPDFPPYRHVFTDEERLRGFLSLDGFRRSVTEVRVDVRTVTVGEWREWRP